VSRTIDGRGADLTGPSHSYPDEATAKTVAPRVTDGFGAQSDISRST